MNDVVRFHVISELSGCKYFYASTVRDCIASVCHKLGVSVSDIDVESIVADVEGVFSSLV